MSVSKLVAALAAVTLAAVAPTIAPGAVAAAPSTAVLAPNPYERGPAPTNASIEASRGSFAIAQVRVARSAVSGFGGGTVYYPSGSTQGTYGVIALCPGFTASWSSISWLGTWLAL